MPSCSPLIKRLNIAKGDIVAQDDVDAIVSAIRADLEPGGSLNRSLMKAAGGDMDDFILANVWKPRPGDAFSVPGFDLPAPLVIFAVTPAWKDDFAREDIHLLRCCRAAMKTARGLGVRRIAFPALCAGKGGYPAERAARLILQGIMDRMDDEFDLVRIVCNTARTHDAFTARLHRMNGKS